MLSNPKLNHTPTFVFNDLRIPGGTPIKFFERLMLSPETRHTVEVLLEIAETQECDRANAILSQFTELEISHKQIIDVQLLSVLDN